MLKTRRCGFSLIEMMVSLTIGSILMLGLLAFSHQVLAQFKREQDQSRTMDSLSMAQAELLLATRGQEAPFWGEFPRTLELAHGSDHRHGAMDWSETCPEDEGSACLTFWDLRPLGDAPTIYRVVDAEGFPVIQLGRPPEDEGSGLAKELGPMSVLLFASEEQRFCALVASVDGDRVRLVEGEDQPWALPELEAFDPYSVLHLGILEVWHLNLALDDGFGRLLTFEPWRITDGAWEAQRRYTAQSNLLQLVWQSCEGSVPDRLVLVGQDRFAAPLLDPVVLGEHTFDWEVRYVSLEF